MMLNTITHERSVSHDEIPFHTTRMDIIINIGNGKCFVNAEKFEPPHIAAENIIW